MYKKIFFPLLLAASWQRIDAASITVAVVAKDTNTYHRALTALKGADADFVERRDLSALLKEKELAQQGLTQAKDVDFKAAQYLVLIEESVDVVNARIVNRAGKIISSHVGNATKVYGELKAIIDGESAVVQLFAAKPKKGLPVELVTEGKPVRKGQVFNFYIAGIEGEYFLYVLVLQSDGVVNVLAPYRHRKYIKIRLKAGESYDFDKESQLHIKATEPFGTDTVKVIVSKQPIELLEQHLTEGAVRTVKPGSKGAFTRGLSTSIRQMQDGEWGAATQEVKVTP